jgi:hypothetical protein
MLPVSGCPLHFNRKTSPEQHSGSGEVFAFAGEEKEKINNKVSRITSQNLHIAQIYSAIL